MHEKQLLFARKGDGGFNPTHRRASKGDAGFTQEISDAGGQRQGQSQTKVAHNFPRSLFEPIHKRCNCNDPNSKFEVAAGELRATFKSHWCGGRWRGLAGQRADAPSHTSATMHHWCGGRRRVRRARAGFEIDHSEPQARVWRSRGRPGPTAPGPPAAPQATSSIANSG